MQWLGTILLYALTACTESAKGDNPIIERVVPDAYDGPILTESDILPSLSLSKTLREALATENYATAFPLIKTIQTNHLDHRQQKMHTFLLAWTGAMSGNSSGVKPKDIIENTTAPPDYIDYVLGHLHEEIGDSEKAANFFALVPNTSPLYDKSLQKRIEALQTSQQTKRAETVFQELLDNPDPIRNGAN